MLLLIISIAGLLLVVSLALYAGVLLFKLHLQKVEVSKNKLLKTTSLADSIRIIALAVKQEQCDLSEGSLRIVKLLQAMPENKRDYSSLYPSLHVFFDKIKHMPTHEQRKQQNKQERKEMDNIRLNYEKTMKDQLLLEIEQLSHFSVADSEV